MLGRDRQAAEMTLAQMKQLYVAGNDNMITNGMTAYRNQYCHDFNFQCFEVIQQPSRKRKQNGDRRGNKQKKAEKQG